MKDFYVVKLHEKMLKTTKIDLNQKWMTSLTHIKSIHQNRKTSWQQTSSFFEYFNIHPWLPCLQKGLNYLDIQTAPFLSRQTYTY